MHTLRTKWDILQIDILLTWAKYPEGLYEEQVTFH